ncbi:leucine richcontaining 34 [Trypanosoma rangeli]|uniref:Leucine richcontaining 34 n=1 Tax=Trypanosoma rangeli TaxID=5698 RepID=A0A422NW39_TRYRA|nr:leucine richcontaining 34 [Trypanosoma rangeli]RNF09659.1 leucine richcontaining 34 [Trypanosoma rangeli]|eukprot:RNF09659.1 leucine richcontaining 34 [Trypanosoma rangeli]
MWGELYAGACADSGVAPRKEILALEGGAVHLCGNTFDRHNQRLTDDEVVALAATCARLPLVAELHLGYNKVSSRGAAALADAMQGGFRSLQCLDLSHNAVDAEGANVIAAAAATHPSLSTLLLRGNPIGGGGGPLMEKLLRSDEGGGSGVLATLDLENTEQDMKSLVHIARGLARNSTLTTLNLGRPLMSNPDDVACVARHLALALTGNTTLRSLGLGHFNLTDEDLSLLLSPLGNSAVVCLSLRGNKLSQESGATLAKLLTLRPDFVSLDVTANRLRDVGAASLAAAVALHPGLRALHIASNTIGGRGISAIAKAVETNTSLASLRLWGNDFSDASVAELYALREKIESLQEKDFSFYVVDDRPMLARE